MVFPNIFFRFVYDIFQAQDRFESKADIYRIPLLVPQVQFYKLFLILK